MFLVRSEFLAIILLSLLRDICHFHPIEFTRHAAIFLNTFLATAWLKGIHISNNNWQRLISRNEQKKNSTGIITPLDICKAHLEWALERFLFLDSQVNISQQIPLGIKFNKPKNKWPFIFFSQ